MFAFILLALFFFVAPILLIYLCRISKIADKIGAIVMAYALGLLIGNSGILPKPSEEYKTRLGTNPYISVDDMHKLYDEGVITQKDFDVNRIKILQDEVSSVTILFAIPLLLFSLDFKRWLKIARGAMFSFVLAMISLIVVIVGGYFIFRNVIPHDDAARVAGMLVGVYTGSSYNLAAIGTMVHIDQETFILTNTFDIMIGAVALLFLITIAQRTFNIILPTFSESHRHIMKRDVSLESHELENFGGILTRKGLPDLFKSLGIDLIVVAVAGSLSLFIKDKTAQITFVILTLTTLGLIASNIGFIKRIKKTFQVGMYLIIVFSVVFASMGNFREMFQRQFLYLFLFVLLAIFGSMIIHVGLSAIFKVDSDSTIITITALTYSPPFVPVVAGALKNKDVIISGLAVGIVGYAIGNYLGWLMFLILDKL